MRIAFISAVDLSIVIVIDLVACVITSCWGNGLGKTWLCVREF